MIRYKKYQSKAKNMTQNQWYARPAPTETIDLDGLAKHMAAHNTPYSQGCIRGVLCDMADCIKELLCEGKNVKIPNLVIFSVGFQTRGAQTAKEFTRDNIMRFTLKARATGQLRPSTLKGELKVAEYDAYTSPGSDGLQEE